MRTQHEVDPNPIAITKHVRTGGEAPDRHYECYSSDCGAFNLEPRAIGHGLDEWEVTVNRKCCGKEFLAKFQYKADIFQSKKQAVRFIESWLVERG